MAWATKAQKTIGFLARRRIGRPVRYGWAMYGWSQYGESSDYFGVYQMRISRKGIKLGEPIKGRHNICFMRPCWKPYENTPAQNIQTDKFKTAFAMWQALTQEEKEVYNKKALKFGRHGYNYFLSITLKSL